MRRPCFNVPGGGGCMSDMLDVFFSSTALSVAQDSTIVRETFSIGHVEGWRTAQVISVHAFS